MSVLREDYLTDSWGTISSQRCYLNICSGNISKVYKDRLASPTIPQEISTNCSADNEIRRDTKTLPRSVD